MNRSIHPIHGSMNGASLRGSHQTLWAGGKQSPGLGGVVSHAMKSCSATSPGIYLLPGFTSAQKGARLK